MLALKSITFAYRPREDRVLAAVNLGQAEPWSCWLTRRLSLAMLERAQKFLASTSPLAQRTTPDHRTELAAFERGAARHRGSNVVNADRRARRQCRLGGAGGSADDHAAGARLPPGYNRRSRRRHKWGCSAGRASAHSAHVGGRSYQGSLGRRSRAADRSGTGGLTQAGSALAVC